MLKTTDWAISFRASFLYVNYQCNEKKNHINVGITFASIKGLCKQFKTSSDIKI